MHNFQDKVSTKNKNYFDHSNYGLRKKATIMDQIKISGRIVTTVPKVTHNDDQYSDEDSNEQTMRILEAKILAKEKRIIEIGGDLKNKNN